MSDNNQNPFNNAPELVKLTKDILMIVGKDEKPEEQNNTTSNASEPQTQITKVSPETKNASQDTMGSYADSVAREIQKSEEAVQLGVRANAAAITAATYRATERQAGREQGKQAEREKFSALETISKDISNFAISAFGILSAIIINGILMSLLGPLIIPVALLELFGITKILSQIFCGEKKNRDKAVLNASEIQQDLNIKPASEIGTHEFTADRKIKSVLNPADANPVPSEIITLTNVK